MLKIDQAREKPSYVTRAVAARQQAGLDNQPEPRASRGVGDERADDVIVIDDDDNTVQGFPEAPLVSIKIEPEDIPLKPESEPEELGRGQRKKIQRVPILPRMKRQHHKAVGFVQSEEDAGG